VSRRLGACVACFTVVLSVFGVAALASAAEPDDGADEAVVCAEGSLTRQRTEIDADIDVAGFDAGLGTLLEVEVPEASVHLDTDAVFENTAQSAVTFEEHMTYLLTFTSPGGLGSPSPVSGSIERVPQQEIAAFDGTLDFQGTSAVTQPSTARDAAADPVSSTDPGALAAFTGGPVAFHVTSAIGETFVGGGGNVEAKINTYAAATIRVCYRYALPVAPPSSPSTTPPPASTAPVRVGATTVTKPPELAFTGRTDGRLAAAGATSVAIGGALLGAAARHRRRAARSIDVGGIDA
jgi:hypothetical protein